MDPFDKMFPRSVMADEVYDGTGGDNKWNVGAVIKAQKKTDDYPCMFYARIFNKMLKNGDFALGKFDPKWVSMAVLMLSVCAELNNFDKFGAEWCQMDFYYATLYIHQVFNGDWDFPRPPVLFGEETPQKQHPINEKYLDMCMEGVNKIILRMIDEGRHRKFGDIWTVPFFGHDAIVTSANNEEESGDGNNNESDNSNEFSETSGISIE